MPREENQYPKDMQEFVDQGWEMNIRFRINVFNLRDSLNNPEDLLHDILVALMQTKYITRYTPEKGSFKTYLYGFVDNFLKKRYNKENTRHGKYIVTAASLSLASPESDSEFDGSEIFVELMDSGIDSEREAVIHSCIEDIRKELAEFPSNSFNVFEGVKYERCPLTVFDLMMEGASIYDVSQLLGVSRQYIYHIMKKIRSCKSFIDLMSDL